jgi:hypothetical protein
MKKKLSEVKRYGSSLLTFENAKTSKGESLGILTGILYLAPARESVPFGGGNLCPMASKGCQDVCLFTAGRGSFKQVRNARIAKTVYFFQHREAFLEDLEKSLYALQDRAESLGMRPAVRLNGTSDYPFFKMPLMRKFRHLQFYNYTKVYSRMIDYCDGKLPENEHLTFSRSETNETQCADILARGGNVAVVFSTRKGWPLPAEYLGRPVIDGDTHDVRFLDPRGVVVGLRAKGKARADKSGFVVQVGVQS